MEVAEEEVGEVTEVVDIVKEVGTVEAEDDSDVVVASGKWWQEVTV